jgi:hypothetical protein
MNSPVGMIIPLVDERFELCDKFVIPTGAKRSGGICGFSLAKSRLLRK